MVERKDRSAESTGEYATMTSGEVTALEFIGAHPVVRHLGEGVPGRVWECRDGLSPAPDGDHAIVVTVLHPVAIADAGHRQRLAVVVERLKSIPSPYVARTIELGAHDGAVFVARELVQGGDLQTRLDREGAVPMKETLR